MFADTDFRLAATVLGGSYMCECCCCSMEDNSKIFHFRCS